MCVVRSRGALALFQLGKLLWRLGYSANAGDIGERPERLIIP
jgi:hypothetical protein